MGDDPAYLPVGTAVSAKYKGAFCEAKVSKVVRVVKCKITYKGGLGTATLTDEHIRGPLRIGHTVQARHSDKKEYIEATITKIQDCSQYTVVFDDGDITTLRRTALCLKSGRHFNESETLDQLPLTHPEHWGFPVGGGRGGRGRRSRGAGNIDDNDDMSIMGDSGPMSPSERDRPDPLTEMYSSDIGKVVCVEAGDKKKSRDNWFPGLVVVPSAQPTVRINVREEYLIRSFKDGRYYTVPRKEILEFSRDMGRGVENTTLQEAMEKALRYLDRDELPPHWERGPLFDLQPAESDSDAIASDSSDDEPREEKDHFVAQLYKFMDDRGTPLNKNPTIAGRDVDLYRLFRVVHKLGGCNRVTNQNKWRSVSVRLGYAHNQPTINSVRQAYKKFLLNFEDFYRKLGCTMINHPRSSTSGSQTLTATKKSRGRSLIRDRDRATPSSPKPRGETSENEKRDTDSQSDAPEPPDTSNSSSDLDGSQTPKASKNRPKPQSTTTVKQRPGGDKVKALVEKFEEHARASSTTNVEEEKPSQRPRSKSVGPQRSTASTSSGRATPAPRSSQKMVEPVEPKEKPEKEKEKEKPEPKKQKIDNTQRGRKKKDEKSSDNNSSTPNSSTDVSDEPTSQAQVTANVGDKLKVYYGPTHESKVTYEAKVLDIDRDHKDGCVMYLVHYTGWNMRYDEWIRPQRIAENLSAINKAARQQSKLPAKSSSASPKATLPKRGRGTSTSSTSIGSTKEPRSITPQQTTRSPSRRQAQMSRRTRRTSVVSTITSDTDGDENDDTKSDSEPEILPQSNRTRSSTKIDSEQSAEKTEKKRKIPPKRPKESEKTDDNDKTDDEKPPKRAKRLVKKQPIVEKTTDESDEDSSPPKGRDFDLNQIRSELKGFEKAVKVTVTNIDTENAEEKSLNTEKSVSESEKVDKSSPLTDDIYEFKEPEPFEFETRKLTPVDLDKGKKRSVKRDDSPQPIVETKSPPQTPKKKGAKSPQASTMEDGKKRTTPNTYRRNNRRTPTISEDTPEKETTEKKLDDDLFDKLAESPSYNVTNKESTSNKSSPKSVKLTLDSDSEIPPLFRDLPATSSVEIGTSIEDSGSASEDLGPEPPPFDQQPGASTLDHIFKGFTEAIKPIEPPNIPTEKTINTVTSNSDDDDPIGTAINRVMSHTMTDESSSGDELFIRATKKIETVKVLDSVQTAGSVKQISPALQETDSKLLEAISQQTQNLFKKDDKKETEKRESPTLKTTTKIADTILQKLSMIKKIEDTDSNDSQKEESKPILTSLKPEVKIEIPERVKSPKPIEVKPKPKTEIKPVEVQKEKPKPIVEEKRQKTIPPLEKILQVSLKAEVLSEIDKSGDETTSTKTSKASPKVETKSVNPSEPIKDENSEKNDVKAEVKVDASEVNIGVAEDVLVKKRPVRKVVSREYIESDSDSSSSSDQTTSSETDESSSDGANQNRRPKRSRLGRLVIAQDDDSQEPEIEEKPTQAETCESVVSQPETKEEEPSSDISLLLCKETIPGSPASSEPGIGNNKTQNTQSANQENVRTTPKPRSAKSLMLEMPFASAPSNTSIQNLQSQSIESSEKILNSPPPLVERTKNEDVPTRIQMNPSQTSSQSKVSQHTAQQSDMDILTARRVSIGRDDDDEDNPVSIESKKPHDQSNMGHVGRKRRRSHRANDDITTNTTNQPSTSNVQPPPAKRGRKPLNRNLNLTDPNSEDEQPLSSVSTTNLTPSQAHRTPPRSTTHHVHPRYNFLVELDPSMDGPARIALLQLKLSELRKTYNEVKTELAIIDRRRKKLRRRERDQLKQHKQEMMQAAA